MQCLDLAIDLLLLRIQEVHLLLLVLLLALDIFIHDYGKHQIHQEVGAHHIQRNREDHWQEEFSRVYKVVHMHRPCVLAHHLEDR